MSKVRTQAPTPKLPGGDWVVIEHTAERLQFETYREPSAIGRLAIVVGILMLIVFVAVLVSVLDNPFAPRGAINNDLPFGFLGGLFVFVGARLQKGGLYKLAFDRTSREICFERPKRSGTDVQIANMDNVIEVRVTKDPLGARLEIIGEDRGPLNITPPNNVKFRRMHDTAKLIAEFIGVESRFAL